MGGLFLDPFWGALLPETHTRYAPIGLLVVDKVIEPSAQRS